MNNANVPHPLSADEWNEIAAIEAVREAWGLGEDDTGADLAGFIYGARFDFASGGPGYWGDLYILQGDCLTGHPPLVLTRERDSLRVELFDLDMLRIGPSLRPEPQV